MNRQIQQIEIKMNSENQFGQTPLHFAIIKEDFELVKNCLKYKADINRYYLSSKCSKLTPIFLATKNTIKSNEIFKYLLNHGANINKVCIINNNKITIGDQILRIGNINILSHIIDQNIELKLSHNPYYHQGDTNITRLTKFALHCLNPQNEDLVRLLLDTLYNQNKILNSPVSQQKLLYHAIKKEDIKLIRILAPSVDIDQIWEIEGSILTPLFMAARNDSEESNEIFKFLLLHEANINILCNRQEDLYTAYGEILRLGNIFLFEYLMDKNISEIKIDQGHDIYSNNHIKRTLKFMEEHKSAHNRHMLKFIKVMSGDKESLFESTVDGLRNEGLELNDLKKEELREEIYSINE